MPPPAKNSFFAQFLRLADIGHSKSSILNPLQWRTIVYIAAIVIIQFSHAPSWLTILFAVLVVFDFIILSVAYFYFMRQRPHSLRSEGFDFKVTELLQNRSGEIKAGQYEEVSFISETNFSGPPEPSTSDKETNRQ